MSSMGEATIMLYTEIIYSEATNSQLPKQTFGPSVDLISSLRIDCIFGSWPLQRLVLSKIVLLRDTLFGIVHILVEGVKTDNVILCNMSVM